MPYHQLLELQCLHHGSRKAYLCSPLSPFLSPLLCKWRFAVSVLWLQCKTWVSAVLAGTFLMLFLFELLPSPCPRPCPLSPHPWPRPLPPHPCVICYLIPPLTVWLLELSLSMSCESVIVLFSNFYHCFCHVRCQDHHCHVLVHLQCHFCCYHIAVVCFYFPGHILHMHSYIQ